MPEDLKLSQIGSSQLPPPFRGLHSLGVRKHCQIIFACYFRKSSIVTIATHFFRTTLRLTIMHHHATFGYKRLSGSGGILLTKPEQTDIQTHGQTDTGNKLCSLRSVNQDGYIRVEGGHKDTVNPGIKKIKD